MEIKLASLTRRSLAVFIDFSLLLCVQMFLLHQIYGDDYFVSPKLFEGVLDFLFNWVFPQLYFLIFWATKGATPGKMALSIKVVDKDSLQMPSVSQALKRSFGLYLVILTFGLGYLVLLITKRSQTLHDMFSGTIVVKGGDVTEFKEPIFRVVGNVLAAVSIVFFSSSPYLVLASSLGFVPRSEVVYGDDLHSSVHSLLVEKNILQEREKIVLYYSSSTFSYLEDGNILTDERVVSYWQDDDKMKVNSIKLNDIEDVEMNSSGSWLEDTVIYVYSDSEFLTLVAGIYKGKDKEFFERLKKYIKINREITS